MTAQAFGQTGGQPGGGLRLTGPWPWRSPLPCGRCPAGCRPVLPVRPSGDRLQGHGRRDRPPARPAQHPV